MSAHTAADVARWFLAYNRIVVYEKGAELLSNQKLQMLLYYAQGASLAIDDKPMFDDKINAWECGPVVENVYRYYSGNANSGILFEDDFNFSDYTDEEHDLLQEVYETFGQYSVWKLTSMVKDEIPWYSTKRNTAIDSIVLRDFFRKKYLLDTTYTLDEVIKELGLN
ncbi:MAG: DUF4065 domain-containing protein [Clostridia bacterium]|nr:DUF4065 domain-containing protein [Clostridia bacterium]